jgi:hypothetical protein
MKLLFRVALFFVACTAVAQTPVRLSWQEFARDPNRVQSFRNAVATMKSRNSADRTSVEYRKSWEYWANMHGYFGTNAKSGTIAQWREANDLTDPEYDPYFAGVQNTSPPDSVAEAVWDQCQHRTNYFFAWHRLFLFYFEKVLQDAAGDPTLRLPYWDYTNPANLSMPAEFTVPTYEQVSTGRTVDNPLYESRREPGWQAPSTIALDQENTDIDLALDNPNLLNTTNAAGEQVTGYQSTIEASPHGYVHCAVMGCRATVMGAVPYSSNDPIFWIHHCNIDRLWDCWLNAGHTNPSSIMGQQFSYVDATGTQVTKLVSNLFDGSLIDYVYQQPRNCARPKVPSIVTATTASVETVTRARLALRQRVLIGEAKLHRIDAPLTRKRVTLPATASLAHPRQFALRQQTQLPVATELVLRRIHFLKHPGANFRVYLQRPDNPSRKAFVGTISFFSEEPFSTAHHAQTEDTRVFDATAELRFLGFDGTGTFTVDVVFEAEEGAVGPDFNPTESRLVIEEIELYVKRDL